MKSDPLQQKFALHNAAVKGAKDKIEADINGLLIDMPNEFNHYGYTLMNTVIGKYKPWEELDVEYRTVMNKQSLYNILQFSEIAPPGIAVECGVYEGGVSRMLMDSGREVYAFDTFEGMISADADSIIDDGEFSVRYDDVSKYLEGATIVKGDIMDTMDDHFSDLFGKVAFVHLDMDMYNPTVYALKNLYGMIISGGIIVLDDYGNWMTPGIKRAVDEFNECSKIYLPTGQIVIMVK